MSKTKNANQAIVKIAGKSKKYSSNAALITKETSNNTVSIEKAVELLFQLEQPKFVEGASVELHVKLNINPTKSDQLIRASVSLPHGTGKALKVVAFVNEENVSKIKALGLCYKVGSDDLVDEIKASGKVDFDIAIAEPDMMKKLPAIARVLGVAGVMPNPKTGTVSDDVEGMLKTILAGKVDYKNDKSGNVHIPCGKVNPKFDVAKIIENVTAAMESVEKAKPDVIKKKYIVSAHLATTMSPSIKIR
jgi:large subunit ribosomal protein L1